MIFLLSPAKTFRKIPLTIKIHDNTLFNDKTRELQRVLIQKTQDELKKIFHCSDAVAQKTRDYYLNPTQKSAALGTFHGEAFRNFHAETMDDEAWNFANQHLYILSAYYGILRCQDPVVFHRLDPHDRVMAESLIHFWHKELTDFLNNQKIISLASLEYAQMLQGMNYYQVEFHQNDKLVHSMLAKKLRGLLARMCVDLRVDSLLQFCQLQIEGFICNEVRQGKIRFIQKL